MASNDAFSSPVLATLAGREQLVVLNRHILYGVEPEDGSVLWDMPLPHFRGMCILTPHIWGDTIFTSPYRQRSYRVDIRAEAERFRPPKPGPTRPPASRAGAANCASANNGAWPGATTASWPSTATVRSIS